MDPIERRAAIDALCDNCDNVQAVCPHYPCKQYTAIDALPSAQPEQLERCPIYGGVCGYPSDQCYECPRHHGAQPEPQWIPCSEPPKESGTYIVTAYDGTDKRVTFVKYQKTLKRWDLTGARAYWRILAYKPLPEPWRGES